MSAIRTASSRLGPSVRHRAHPRRVPGSLRHALPGLPLKLLVTAAFLLATAPLLWMVATSLQSTADVYRLPMRLLPSDGFQWPNYSLAWERMGFGRALGNSVLVSLSVTVAQLVCAAVAGFALARWRGRLRNLMLASFLLAFLVPFQLTWIPSFFMLNGLSLIDTHAALIVPFLAGPFGVLILYTHLNAIPREYEEAALLEGCTAWQALRHVIIPLSAPGLKVVAASSFLFSWSDLIWPLLMTHSTELRTLPVGLSTFRNEFATEWPLLMAGSAMAALPVLAVTAMLIRNLGAVMGERSRAASGALVRR